MAKGLPTLKRLLMAKRSSTPLSLTILKKPSMPKKARILAALHMLKRSTMLHLSSESLELTPSHGQKVLSPPIYYYTKLNLYIIVAAPNVGPMEWNESVSPFEPGINPFRPLFLQVPPKGEDLGYEPALMRHFQESKKGSHSSMGEKMEHKGGITKSRPHPKASKEARDQRPQV